MALLWFAPQAAVEIGSAIASFSGSSTIQTQMTALADEFTYSGMVQDVRISGGERDIDAKKTFGYNELTDQKRASIIETSLTIGYQGSIKAFSTSGTRGTNLDTAEWFMGVKQTVTGNYKRATGGEKSANDRTTKAVHFKLTNGTNTISILMNNALCTTRELSIAADGHMEETITFKCLASNYYEEDDFT